MSGFVGKICILTVIFATIQAQSEVQLEEQLELERQSDDTRAVTAAGTEGTDGTNVDKVYLRSITALVFSENGRARSRNGAGKQQLRCVGGSASGFWWFSEFYPHVVQCRNIGWDGANIQWSCEGNLNDYVEFGAETRVVCEPYDEDAKDGYVLRGSCRLEYTLNFKKFHISAVHIVYGCSLTICLLWWYYQSRFFVHQYLKARAVRKAKERKETARQPF